MIGNPAGHSAQRPRRRRQDRIARQKAPQVRGDVSGRLVRTLVNGPLAAGAHTAVWNGRDDQGNLVSSGVYFYRLESDAFSGSRKMILLK